MTSISPSHQPAVSTSSSASGLATDRGVSAELSKILSTVASSPLSGVQFSLFGMSGLPAHGFDKLSPVELTQLECKLESTPGYLCGSHSGDLAIVHREGFTFEFVTRREGLLYREDREVLAGLSVPKILPEITENRKFDAALERTVVIGGRASWAEANTISGHLGIKPYQPEHLKFANSESFVNLPESIRGRNVVLVQSFAGDVDIALMSTMLLLNAAKRASAESITLVMPYLPYARQDRRGSERTAVAPEMLMSMLDAAAQGALKRIVTVDMHSLQIEGMSGKITVDNLSGAALFLKPLKQYLAGEEFAVVFPDAGARKRASDDRFDSKLLKAFSFIPKIGTMNKSRGIEKNTISRTTFEGDPDAIKGKSVVMFDDMIDTGGTAMESIKLLHALGAKRVIFCGTHPLVSRGAVERFRNETVTVERETRRAVDKLFVCDTVPLRRGRGDLIEVVNAMPLLSHFLLGAVSDGGFSTRELAELYSGTNGH